ncbi:MAG: class I SAM-dependent methyltransferase [Candidatus Omnitrophota bacterium]
MSIEKKIWKKIHVNYPAHIPTMLTPEEIQYLYWLGRSWNGSGRVMEIGCWLGGSTFCLASGMRDSGHDATKRLKVLDNFIWRPFMAERAALPLQPGESFEPYFLKNMAGFENIIDTRACALPDDPGSHENIFTGFLNDSDTLDILFIDGAKSWPGMRYLLKTLNRYFVPGQTLLVCQDYKYWGTYWVPVIMTLLENYVEIVHNVRTATTVTFRLVKPIPDTLLDTIPPDQFNMKPHRLLNLLEKSATDLSTTGDNAGAANLKLGKVSFLLHRNEIGWAVDIFTGIQKSWKLHHPTWQLERVRTFLAKEKKLHLPRPRIHQIADSLRYRMKKIVGKIVRTLLKKGSDTSQNFLFG